MLWDCFAFISICYNLLKSQCAEMHSDSTHNYSPLLTFSATNENRVYNEINMMVGLNLSFYVYYDCPSLFAPQRDLSAPMVSRDYDRNQLWLRHVITRCSKIVTSQRQLYVQNKSLQPKGTYSYQQFSQKYLIKFCLTMSYCFVCLFITPES
jgi:hypothetical protein